MYKLFVALMVCISPLMAGDYEMCVTVSPSTGTYTVDSQGCVNQPSMPISYPK